MAQASSDVLHVLALVPLMGVAKGVDEGLDHQAKRDHAVPRQVPTRQAVEELERVLELLAVDTALELVEAEGPWPLVERGAHLAKPVGEEMVNWPAGS